MCFRLGIRARSRGMWTFVPAAGHLDNLYFDSLY